MEIRRDGNYKLRYKCIGRPTSEQLSVWAIPCKRETDLREHEADASEQGTSKAGSERRYRLYVNVFGGAADGKVTVLSLIHILSRDSRSTISNSSALSEHTPVPHPRSSERHNCFLAVHSPVSYTHLLSDVRKSDYSAFQ